MAAAAVLHDLRKLGLETLLVLHGRKGRLCIGGELREARDALAGLAFECASKRKGPCPILKAFDPK